MNGRKTFRRWLAMIAASAAMTGTLVAANPAPALASSCPNSYVQTVWTEQCAPSAAPQVGASESRSASDVYLSTQISRDRSSVKVAAAAGTLANRCPAFVTWEDWIGGARVHAYVDFRPSDTCDGRHVKRAYVTLIRQCGPYFNTGRIYTYTATSTSDTRLYSVSAWIFDSVLWGCITNTYYGYDYF